MPVVTLTDISIRALKPVPGRRVTYFDKGLKGFGIRLSDTGRASYVLVLGANRQRVKIGDVGTIRLADARSAARKMLAEKQLGHYTAIRSSTFQAAVDDFLEARQPALKPRTYRDYKRLLNRHGFREEKLTNVTPHDIQKKLVKLPSGERFHAHVALSIFFRWAFRRYLIERNPMERMDLPAKGKARSRVLADDEIKAVWLACAGTFGDIIKLCLLLGQRRGEIVNLRWEWIKGDLITFPAQTTKNGREHTVPCGTIAMSVFHRIWSAQGHGRPFDEEAARCATGGYVFPARKMWRKQSTVYNAWNKDMPKLRAASETEGWVPHDLRRTFRSKWAALGVRREVAEKYINHVSGVQSGVESVYDRHSYLPEMRAAVAEYEAHILTLISTSGSARLD